VLICCFNELNCISNPRYAGKLFHTRCPGSGGRKVVTTVDDDDSDDDVGPFQQLNAEAIEQELGEMSRALYKLSKSFSDQPAPRNVADRVRRQIEKFKSYQALLNVICNPGIRDRHWKKVT